MTKNEITILAQKLGWTQKEVENAVNELRNYDSILEHDEVLRRCFDSVNSTNRKSNITRLISKHLKEENLVNIISKWLLSPDICFKLWAFFNAYDKNKLSSRSFIKSNTFLSSNIDLNPYHICNQYLDFYINSLNVCEDIEVLMHDVAKQSGFLIFNINTFQKIASSYFYNPFLNEKHKELINNLNKPLPSSKKNREYWLIYVLVKKLEPKLGTLNAFEEIARMKYNAPSSIKTRYYELTKKARKAKLSVDEIINRYQLEKAVDELLT